MAHTSSKTSVSNLFSLRILEKERLQSDTRVPDTLNRYPPISPYKTRFAPFFGKKVFGGNLCNFFLLSCRVVSEKNQKKTPSPYHYIFQYPLTNNMFRYLETKQLKNGGLNTLRVPKTGKVCHVFDPGAHTGRVEAKDGNIIETQHLNIESKHQLKAHCAII